MSTAEVVSCPLFSGCFELSLAGVESVVSARFSESCTVSGGSAVSCCVLCCCFCCSSGGGVGGVTGLGGSCASWMTLYVAGGGAGAGPFEAGADWLNALPASWVSGG